MLGVKVLEVRDRATFIPCVGVLLDTCAEEPEARYLLGRAGYDTRWGAQPLILFGRADGGLFTYDPYRHPANPRTLRYAHLHVCNYWDRLTSGDVVDVEFILHETSTPKTSERMTCP